jgi:hypothetical protein
LCCGFLFDRGAGFFFSLWKNVCSSVKDDVQAGVSSFGLSKREKKGTKKGTIIF